MSIVIVDTGVANLASVMFAFERLKVAPVVSQDPAVIAAAERIIIPGVGAAPAAMQNIKARGLTEVLQNLTQPTMGICMGKDHAYFVHSYAAEISSATLAYSSYGQHFSAVVRHKNVWGCQFHPERSSKTGARILSNFLKVSA